MEPDEQPKLIHVALAITIGAGFGIALGLNQLVENGCRLLSKSLRVKSRLSVSKELS